MSWIEERISDVLANFPEEEILKDQWVHRLVRLAVLDRMAGSRSWKPVQARKVRKEFNKELEEFLNERTWPLESPSESKKTDSVVYHYERLNALTHLIELTSAHAYLHLISEATRREAKALSDSYNDWCGHILGRWGDTMDRHG